MSAGDWLGITAASALGLMWLVMWLFYAHNLDTIGRVLDWLDRRFER